MSNDSGYFKLGLFVIIGVALIVGGVVLFGAGALFREYATLETATTSSVEGLSVGAAVKYNGVTLGQVSRIYLARTKYHEMEDRDPADVNRFIIVEMEIRRDMLITKTVADREKRTKELVERGMRVRMASSGLTGPPYIEVVFLDPQSYPPPELPYKPSALYVPSAPSQMSVMFANVEAILRQVKEADVAQTLVDVRTLLKSADRRVNELEVKELVARLRQILDNPKIDETINGLGKTASSAPQAMADLRRAIKRLDQLLGDERADIEAILVNLRRVLEDAAAVAEDARSNPSRLLFGQPPPHTSPGEEKK